MCVSLKIDKRVPEIDFRETNRLIKKIPSYGTETTLRLFCATTSQSPLLLLIRKLANYVNANCRLLLRNVIFMDINH